MAFASSGASQNAAHGREVPSLVFSGLAPGAPLGAQEAQGGSHELDRQGLRHPRLFVEEILSQSVGEGEDVRISWGMEDAIGKCEVDWLSQHSSSSKRFYPSL